MPGIMIGVLGICLLAGAMFAVYWARRNKREMKAAYPGAAVTTLMPDKQHTLWLHGNALVTPKHSLGPAPASEYAELTHNGIHKINTSAPPEPYATVTLQRGGGTSDESCVKCSASPSSSEYNAPFREPININEMIPPPPDHPYGTYRHPNNMTIRTNPAALSPQIMRRVPPTPPRWGTMPPPIPNFPQNWMQHQRLNAGLDCNPANIQYSENDYESGSVLYEQCFRPEDTEYFSHRGEPTEEFYRSVNMEFAALQNDFEPGSPPAPCPETPYSNKANSNLRLFSNAQQQQQILLQQQQQLLQQQQQHQQQQQLESPINSRKPPSSRSQTSTQSSDSESDNHWAPRSRRSRSRSKSSDRKYHRQPNNVR
jgi:roundabout, axon guidance receptor 2